MTTPRDDAPMTLHDLCVAALGACRLRRDWPSRQDVATARARGVLDPPPQRIGPRTILYSREHVAQLAAWLDARESVRRPRGQ
jgi:hypothetical protein